ncbi:hypothetical protein M1N89_01960, partial [Dehalococcoidia bacterium]|nr:hypothetical protein [Dehalococcoidia bacterium]
MLQRFEELHRVLVLRQAGQIDPLLEEFKQEGRLSAQEFGQITVALAQLRELEQKIIEKKRHMPCPIPITLFIPCQQVETPCAPLRAILAPLQILRNCADMLGHVDNAVAHGLEARINVAQVLKAVHTIREARM